MGLYGPHFRKLITDELRSFNPKLLTPAAVELLLMTAAHESHFGRFLYQISGPALGVFQIEPATHDSIFENYFKRRYPGFAKRDSSALAGDIGYQVIVARGIYADKTEPLPAHDDIAGLAAYYKKHWNTYRGAAKEADVIRHYSEYVKKQ